MTFPFPWMIMWLSSFSLWKNGSLGGIPWFVSFWSKSHDVNCYIPFISHRNTPTETPNKISYNLHIPVIKYICHDYHDIISHLYPLIFSEKAISWVFFKGDVRYFHIFPLSRKSTMTGESIKSIVNISVISWGDPKSANPRYFSSVFNMPIFLTVAQKWEPQALVVPLRDAGDLNGW